MKQQNTLETVANSPLGYELRKSIAARYLTGSGIEIGALNSPLEIPNNVTVRYLDRMPINQLRQHYPELSQCDLVEIDIVDDGETLATVASNTVDFIIANHMIEHCQNPILTIKNWLRTIKLGGILYMAVPDKRYTFDIDRPVTDLEHLIRDYTEGPKWSRNAHFEEWARIIDKVQEHEVTARAQFIAEINYSIHFHVWTQVEFVELLLYCRNNLSLPIEIELLQKDGVEFICVLRKTSEELACVNSLIAQKLESNQPSALKQEHLPSPLHPQQMNQLQSQLQSTQTKLQEAESLIAAMETSKFWKLRKKWFKLKKLIGLKEQDVEL